MTGLEGDQVVGLAQALIRIPSEDPGDGTDAVASFVRDFLSALGGTPEVLSPAPGKSSVVCTFSFSEDGPAITLNGHLETLPAGAPDRWRFPPFAAVVENARLFGRGAACMKGGIAAVLGATSRLVGAPPDRGTLHVVLVADEINGGALGTGLVLEQRPKLAGDVALVAESSSGVNIGNKGVILGRLTTDGTADHGAYGFRSPSANHRLLEALGELAARIDGREVAPPPDLAPIIWRARRHTDRRHGTGATDALTRVTLNVGRIDGGTKANVIAERAEAELDVRVPAGLAADDLEEEIGAVAGGVPGTAWRTTSKNDATWSVPTDPWFALVRDRLSATLGVPQPFRFSHGFTDARFFRERGVPTVAIGVEGGGMGAPDEWLTVSSLLALTRTIEEATRDRLEAAT
jgi:succinyl-diaminopimelate desuccinylase